MAGTTPTPLPDVKLREITPEDVPGSLVAIRASLENVLYHLARIRSVIFDETAIGEVRATLGGLLARVKDGYVFTLSSLSATERRAGVLLRVLAAATIKEVRADLETGSGAVTVTVDGETRAQFAVTTAGASVVPVLPTLVKDQVLEVLASGTGTGLVVQVRAG